MSLSHEIIVLDYGDEQTSPFEFDRPSKQRARGGNGKHFSFSKFCCVPYILYITLASFILTVFH